MNTDNDNIRDKNNHIDDEFNEDDPLKQNDDSEKEDEKRNLSEAIIHILGNITVEPCMLLFITSCILMSITTQNLNLEKACRVNLNFTDEICSSLKMQEAGSQNEYEREAQKLLASAMAKKTYISATLPCILALFVGAWSDKTGHRKVFMIVSTTGQILICLNNMINVYFFHQLPLEVLVFSEALLEGLSGGWCICLTSMFSYISAITTEKTRTFRMGLLNFTMTVGFPLGMGTSGALLKKYGYYGCYGLALSLHILNVIYNIFILKDPKRNKEHKKHDRQGVKHFFRTFFDLSNVKETISVIFKKTPNNRRLRLCILILVVCTLFGPMYGEVVILYMNTRYRFNWDEVKFSIFQTYNFITHTVGTVFSILVFSKYLKWHDSILGIISTISKIAASFFYCFAVNEKMFFLAPLVEILNGTSFLAIRSIFTKVVEPYELGKVNAIVGLSENLMPLLYIPVYTKVYTATMEVLPGAVFLMGAAMTMPATFVFIWLLIDHRKVMRKTKLEEEIKLPE